MRPTDIAPIPNLSRLTTSRCALQLLLSLSSIIYGDANSFPLAPFLTDLDWPTDATHTKILMQTAGRKFVSGEFSPRTRSKSEISRYSHLF